MNEDDFIKETNIKGVFVIERPFFGDDRGFFREIFRKTDLEKRTGFEVNIKQANHSRSSKGVLRGIHIAPWHKIVTVMTGKAQQVVVDLREGSETFGQYFTVVLGEEKRASLFIPAGCGNAFLVLSETADYNYMTTDYWAPGLEKSVAYNDPDIGIKWELEEVELSDKDKQNPTLREAFPKK